MRGSRDLIDAGRRVHRRRRRRPGEPGVARSPTASGSGCPGGARPTPPVAVGGGGAGGSGGSVAAPDRPPAPVDLNTATAEELDTLPGVGPATAAAIIDHRQRNGPFRSVDDLADVRGIGDAKLAQLRELVRV